jgi:outer membrane lipoprotein-sorting protein
MVVALVLLLVAPGAEPNEAEKLYRNMEAKIANAKNITCVYDVSAEGGKDNSKSVDEAIDYILRMANVPAKDGRPSPVRGKLWLSEGNKCRTETWPLAAVLPNTATICDGKRLVVLHEDVPAETRDAPKWFADTIRGKITRSFTVLDAQQLAKQQDFKLDEQFAVGDFKLGKKETIGDAEAQVIEFKLTVKGVKRPFAVSLWLDTKSNLPLKRDLVMPADDKEIRITETFGKLDFDAKPDPKNFDLPNEAEQIFRRMEAKVIAAKTIECQVEVQTKAEKKEIVLKGTLLLDEGRKVRMDVTEEQDGKTKKGTLVSDGKTMAAVGTLPTKRDAETAPPWLAGATRAALVRASLTVPTDFFVRGSAANYLEFLWVNGAFRLSDFKLGEKEKVGDHEAQIVEYNLVLVFRTYSVPVAVQLWIDTKTDLPLKRVLTVGMGDGKMTMTESYSKITLDGKIDPKQFELPKE